MTAQRQKSERRGFLLDGEGLDAIRGELLPRGVGGAGKLRLVVVVVVVAVVVALRGDHGSGGEVRRERSEPNQRLRKTTIIKTCAIGTRSREVKWRREKIARKIQTLCEKFLECFFFFLSSFGAWLRFC